jgi:ATP-dependent Lhr-like helicase
VDGLGAAQFATDGAIDRLRAVSTALERRAETGASESPDAVVLAAADPANAYGAALPWPEPPGGAASSHKPGRKAGALVALVDGELVAYVERGGKTLLSWAADHDRLAHAATALARAVHEGALRDLMIERINGEPALTAALSPVLESAGFLPTPRGLRVRA